MRFLILADIHGHERFLGVILRSEPDCGAVVIAGDITQAGGPEEAERIIALIEAPGRRILAVPGNMDRPEVLGFLERKRFSLHGTGVMVGTVGFFGVGASNPTPFGTPFEMQEEEIERLARRGRESVEGAAVKVFVTHVPPRRTTLDRTALGLHVGSDAVRRFLAEHPADVCLCAHIHEAAGEETIDGVRACNPGAVKDGRYAVLDIHNGSIDLQRRKMTSWT